MRAAHHRATWQTLLLHGKWAMLLDIAQQCGHTLKAAVKGLCVAPAAAAVADLDSTPCRLPVLCLRGFELARLSCAYEVACACLAVCGTLMLRLTADALFFLCTGCALPAETQSGRVICANFLCWHCSNQLELRCSNPSLHRKQTCYT